jgi:sugar O-acyltransferase (sialic acid O-acetyltransferase NeuD family)
VASGKDSEHPEQREDMKEKIVLIGGGGHCKSCIDVVEAQDMFAIEGIVDMATKIGRTVLGYPIIADDADLVRLTGEFRNFLITIGQIGSPEKRMETFQSIKSSGGRFPVIVSPKAYVSKHATIGEGTILMHGVTVNAGSVIGVNCIINTGSIIEHDVIIEDHCHISTGSTVNGGCIVRRGSFLGSNSVTREGIIIKENSFIKANSIVSASHE